MGLFQDDGSSFCRGKSRNLRKRRCHQRSRKTGAPTTEGQHLRECSILADGYDKHTLRSQFLTEHVRFLRSFERCFRCNRAVPGDLLQIDHIVPRGRGGPTTRWNLQPLCSTCNATKWMRAPRLIEVFPQIEGENRRLHVASARLLSCRRGEHTPGDAWELTCCGESSVDNIMIDHRGLEMATSIIIGVLDNPFFIEGKCLLP